MADCFTDHRDPKRIQYILRGLITQRILGIALGYEDLNDQFRHDPLMALFSEKGRTDSTPLAGKSTLNRLEHAPTQGPGRRCVAALRQKRSLIVPKDAYSKQRAVILCNHFFSGGLVPTY